MFTSPNTSKHDDSGASMVEYALLVVLIAIVAFAAVQLAGQELSTTYGNIADEVQNASSSAN
jgi:pilus assembly protein Flp/PilA